MINSAELLTNANLKVFKTEFYNEASERDALDTLKHVDTTRISYLNIKSFMPIPTRGSNS